MIKLVIWDLDETLWRGTLAEEVVTLVPGGPELIHALVDRGIMCSVASKNEFSAAKDRLEDAGLWGLLVFPEICYHSKADMVRRILSRAQLRAANALFIDDNRLNREEVKYSFPEMRVEHPDVIVALLGDPDLAGKSDPTHDRLRQYKELEQRKLESSRYDSNETFLRQAQITVKIGVGRQDVIASAARVLELVGRANQLNFTKASLDSTLIEDLLRDDRYSLGVVSASDRYGDYGVVGFYAVDVSLHRLQHFVFSCRILNLGIEQWVYASLGYPAVRVVQPVAAILADSGYPEWISTKSLGCGNSDVATGPDERNYKILLKGGCDLQQVVHYLSSYSLSVATEMTFVTRRQNSVHWEDSTVLLNSLRFHEDDLAAAIRGLPFADMRMFRTSVFDDGYDCLVYSVLMDYTRQLYRHKATGVLVPFGDHFDAFDGPTEVVVERLRSSVAGGSSEFVERFRDEFDHVGQISPDAFLENVEAIRLHVKRPIVFINGAEVSPANDCQREAIERHRVMNRAIQEYVRTVPDCALVDVREIVQDARDLTDCIRHYKRAQYPRLAEAIVAAVARVAGRAITRKFSAAAILYAGREMLKESTGPVARAIRGLRGRRPLG